MIGSLVHYNCAGSKALGIVIDFVRMPRGKSSGFIKKNDLLIAVAWAKTDKIIPWSITPNLYWAGDPEDDFWPAGWKNKRWYKASWFRTLMEGESP